MRTASILNRCHTLLSVGRNLINEERKVMINQGTRIWGLAAVALMLVWPAVGAESSVKKHFEHGKAALMKKNLKAAGRELRGASEDLGKAARSSSAAAKEGLESSAREVRSLGEDVEKGAVTDTKRIDDAAGRAYHALARERFVTATDAWARKDSKATGKALKDAAEHLEDGAAIAGKDAAAATKDVAKGTRDVAGKLIQGSGWTSAEVGKGMDSFGKELASLGRRVGSKI
jgi:hypothetical protein